MAEGQEKSRSRVRRSHADTDGPTRPQAPVPSHAEQARTLVSQASEGSLATLSHRRPGDPFVSLMPFAEEEDGSLLLLVSNLAVHTRNLDADPRASLLVREAEAGDRDPLGLARVTLVGGTARVGAPELEMVRSRYLDRHPNARYWVDFSDFSFRRMRVEEAYYVGGFGVMGWVDGEAYATAEPDPLRDAAAGILEHVNEDHVDALLLLARHAGIEAPEEARMTGVDRLGFNLRVRTAERVQGLRLAFPAEARTGARVRECLVAMVGEAREAQESLEGEAAAGDASR